ncbi:MAG: hypothetical protein FWH11_12895 [Micrococcales bacterium]|nr:hypothetical protein [Micrococcales bacterium]
MSHRSRGPIRLFAVSFLFTASIAVGAGGALAVAANPDGQSGTATTVSPTPLPTERPTCPPTQTASTTPPERGGSAPTETASTGLQATRTPSGTVTPTATAVAKNTSPLARTGSNVAPIVGVLALALVVGGVLVIIARRRATR